MVELTDKEIDTILTRMECDIRMLKDLQRRNAPDQPHLVASFVRAREHRKDIVNKLKLFKVANSNQDS